MRGKMCLNLAGCSLVGWGGGQPCIICCFEHYADDTLTVVPNYFLCLFVDLKGHAKEMCRNVR